MSLKLIRPRDNFHLQDMQEIVEQAKWQQGEASKPECGLVGGTTDETSRFKLERGDCQKVLKRHNDKM